MSDLMRKEMKKAYEDVVGEPWDDAGLHKQAWCISWEKAWQASRETLVIEMPKPAGLDRMSSDMTMQEIREDNRFNRALDLAVKAIHAAGVKTR